EIKKFCHDVKPVYDGTGRVIDACLKTHESELPAGCRQKIQRDEDIEAAGAAAEKACQTDARTLCADSLRMGFSILGDCLSAHDASLSSMCRQSLELSWQRSEWWEERDACQADAQKFCPGEEPKGRIISCLKAHHADLLSSCMDRMRMLALAAAEEGLLHQCDGDFQRYCSDAYASNSRDKFGDCIKAHTSDFSAR